MTINVKYIKYTGGRNLCRDEELDRKIWDTVPHGLITYMENNTILRMAKRRQKVFGGLLRENQHICWHIILQRIVMQRLTKGKSFIDTLQERKAA